MSASKSLAFMGGLMVLVSVVVLAPLVWHTPAIFDDGPGYGFTLWSCIYLTDQEFARYAYLATILGLMDGVAGILVLAFARVLSV